MSNAELLAKFEEFSNSEYAHFLKLLRETAYQRYWTTHAHKWHQQAKEAPYTKQVERDFRRHILRFLPRDKTVRILDGGCGYGSVVAFLKDNGYLNVEGVDVSAEQVQIAHKLGLKEVKQADLFDFLKGKNEVYDIIILRDILEHQTVFEALYLLLLVKKALRAGGRIIVRGPSILTPFPVAPFGDVTHMSILTPSSLEQMLSIAGFEQVRVEECGIVVHGVKSFVRWLLWLGFKAFWWLFMLARTAAMRPPMLSDEIMAYAVKGEDGEVERHPEGPNR